MAGVRSDLQSTTSSLSGEHLNGREQLAERSVYEPPNQDVIYIRVTVDEHVTKCDELAIIGQAARKGRVELAELTHGFTNDLELSLDTGAEQRFLFVVGERFARGEFKNEATGPFDVEEVFTALQRQGAGASRIRRQRGSLGIAGHFRGKTDF